MRARSLSVIALVAVAAWSAATDHGLVNAIRGVVIGQGSNSDPNSDVTHTASGLVGPLTTSTLATYSFNGGGGVASGSVKSDYGQLAYDVSASAAMNQSAPGKAYLGGLGGNTGEDYDKITVVGPGGGIGTFTMRLRLLDMDIRSASEFVNSGIDHTGILSVCNAHFDDGSNAGLNVYDYLDTPSSRLSYIDASGTFFGLITPCAARAWQIQIGMGFTPAARAPAFLAALY